MAFRREPFKRRFRRNARETRAKIARLFRALAHRLERARVSYALGPFDESERSRS